MKKAPQHLEPIERALWADLTRTYSIDDGAGLALLQTALEALQRARQCREQVEADGMLVKGKAHPLLGLERDSRRAFILAIDKLGLDLEPAGIVGRPEAHSVRRVK